MRIKSVFASLLISHLVLSFCVLANGATGTSLSRAELARLATSPKPSESGPALAALRDEGPSGLALLFQVYADDIARFLDESGTERASDPKWIRLTTALDKVSQQRDSYASGLYWYTDFEKAKAAARASGKPILSLRLLGNLTDEFSCANSRFFRAVLYPNTQVSAFMRDHFILHWKSVRPVPKVTIDFGDGRKIERTLTGNSIHYVLDSDGQPIDAIPGLYGPKAFLRELTDAERAFKTINPVTGADRILALKAYHLAAKRAASTEWQYDITRAGVAMTADDSVAESDGSAKSAEQASRVTVNKAVSELPTIRRTSLVTRPSATSPSDKTAQTPWEAIAALHDNDVKLDSSSIALIKSQYRAMALTDDALSRIVQNLERNLATDTVRNRYLIHSRIHQWFVDGVAGEDINALNERVYARLFLTPSSDPWLGLFSADTYSGLIDGGIVTEK
ncbi:MAG TPA: hypothetical protein VI756_00490 [Blastocatellia bacterium]